MLGTRRVSAALALGALIVWPACGQAIVYDTLPAKRALFPRDAHDSASVVFSGRVESVGYDSVLLRTYKGAALASTQSRPLTYGIAGAPFRLTSAIHAELSMYRFELLLRNNGGTAVQTSVDSIVCGDVYLVGGQSNAVACNRGNDVENPYLRSFGFLTQSVPYAPADTFWGGAYICDYRGGGSYVPGCPGGGVGSWAYTMMSMIKDTFGIPVAILNNGVGSAYIAMLQRNDANPQDLNTFYGSMLYRARKAGIAGKVKALFWYQGETDASRTDYATYYTALRHMYDNWKTDYPSVQRVYLFQIHTGCEPANHGSALRERQRTFADSLPDVTVVSTMGLGAAYHEGCHWTIPGYPLLGTQLFRIVARDFYGRSYSFDVSAPNIARAAYTSAARSEIALTFRNGQHVTWQDTSTQGGTTHYLNDYFYLDGASGAVSGHRISSDTLLLTLRSSSTATHITYLPDIFYQGTSTVYEGPWVMGTNGVGLLSFDSVPIEPAGVTRVHAAAPAAVSAVPTGARCYGIDGRFVGVATGSRTSAGVAVVVGRNGYARLSLVAGR